MKNFFKFSAYLIAGLIGLLIVVVIILKLIPDTQYKEWITAATRSATGRDFSIGALELDFGTALRVRADKIRLANAEWSDQNDMLRIEHVEADFGILPLLTGKADIRTVLEHAEMLSENNAEGISNWAMGKVEADLEEAAGEAKEGSGDLTGLPLEPFIREIRIDDFKLTMVKAPGADAKIAHLKQLLIETPEKDTTLSLSADLNGRPVSLSGDLGHIERLLYDASEPIHLTGDINGNKLVVAGEWGPLFPKQTMHIDIDLKIPSTARLAVLAGIGEEDFGSLDISGKISADNSALSLDPLLVTLTGPEAKVTVKGAIADLNHVEGISLSAEANTAALDKLVQKLGVDLSVALPPEVEFSTQVSGGLEELALSDLIVVVHDKGMEMKATASIGDLLHTKKITGRLDGSIDSLSRLSRYTQVDLPSLGKLQLSAELASNDKALQLDNLDIRLVSDNINVAVTGGVDDLLTVSGIDALVKAGIDSFSKQNIAELSKMLKQFDAELPAEMLPKSISLSTAIKGSLEQLSLVDIQGEALDEGVKVGLSGAVENVLVPSGVDLTTTVDGDSIAVFSKYAGTDLPDTDPLKLKATLAEDKSKRPVFTLHAETGNVNVDVSSVLASLAVPDKLDMDVSAKAKSLSDFDKLAQAELPDEGPFNLAAKLQIANKAISVNDLELHIADDQSALGNMAVKLPEEEKQPTIINGKLDIPYLDLGFLFAESEDEPAEEEAPVEKAEPTDVAEAEKTQPEAPTDRLFSTEPILLDQLHEYEMDFTVNADRINLGKSDMKDLQVAVSLKDGQLSIDPIKAVGGAGKLNGNVHIDGRGEAAKMKVDLSFLQFTMPRTGAKVDLDVKLAGSGKSVAELMGSLNGQMLLVARDGKIDSGLVRKFGSGLFSSSEGKDYTELECGILRVDVKDGIADFDDKLAAQLTEVTWRGGGEINLKTEELEVGISPKPRKGVPISAGSLASLVHVSGTLKHPHVRLDPKDVAVKYAKYTAHVATGGVTLVIDAIKNKIQANQDVCKQILEGTVFEAADKAKEKEMKKAEKSEKASMKANEEEDD